MGNDTNNKKDLFYKIFSDSNTKYPNDVICRHIDSLNEYNLEISNETVISYIKNKKTKNVLLFTNDKAYVMTLDLFEKICQQDNSLNFSLQDFKDHKELLENDFFDEFDSYGLHDYAIEFPFKQIPIGNWWGANNPAYRFTKYEIFALRRIGWMFSRLFLLSDMFIGDRSKSTTKFQFKINKLYTDKTKNNLLYKEFFIDSDFTIITQMYNNYYGANVNIQNNYLTYNLNDYADKDYGILMNLDKIKFIKKHLGYTFNRLDFAFTHHDIHEKNYNALLGFIPLYNSVNIDADYNNNYIAKSIMDKLQKKYTRKYNSIIKGLKSISNQSNNTSILMFTAYGKSRIAFSISEVRRNDLTLVDMYADRPSFDNMTNILNSISNIDPEHWITIDNYNNRIFINKEVLKNNKDLYKFEVEKNDSYYQTSVALILKAGRRKVVLRNINEQIFDDLCDAGCFDEETKNSLKCQYILLKM